MSLTIWSVCTSAYLEVLPKMCIYFIDMFSPAKKRKEGAEI